MWGRSREQSDKECDRCREGVSARLDMVGDVRIDLHTHSTESDGTQPPEGVVAAAAEAGLDVVALTDHDTTGGWGRAAVAAAQSRIALVRGIEISCSVGGISVHLLGYLPDPTSEPLTTELDRARDSRVTRVRRVVQLLAPDTGLTWEQVRAQAAPGATLGRPHIADALVAAGVVADRGEAFATYLATDGRYHVSHYAPHPVRAVELVRAAGGVPVMAHPLAHRRGRVVDESVIREMAGAGLAGIEVDHRDHDDAARARAGELARELGLFATGSSDYHGAGKHNRLGENTTAPQVLDAIAAQATSPIKILWP